LYGHLDGRELIVKPNMILGRFLLFIAIKRNERKYEEVMVLINSYSLGNGVDTVNVRGSSGRFPEDGIELLARDVITNDHLGIWVSICGDTAELGAPSGDGIGVGAFSPIKAIPRASKPSSEEIIAS
jgi:hypothetical protein